MKRFIAFLLCSIITISLFSCGTANKNEDMKNDTANDEISGKMIAQQIAQATVKTKQITRSKKLA